MILIDKQYQSRSLLPDTVAKNATCIACALRLGGERNERKGRIVRLHPSVESRWIERGTTAGNDRRSPRGSCSRSDIRRGSGLVSTPSSSGCMYQGGIH